MNLEPYFNYKLNEEYRKDLMRDAENHRLIQIALANQQSVSHLNTILSRMGSAFLAIGHRLQERTEIVEATRRNTLRRA